MVNQPLYMVEKQPISESPDYKTRIGNLSTKFIRLVEFRGTYFFDREHHRPSAPKLYEGDITARAVRSYGEVTLWPKNEGIVVVPLEGSSKSFSAKLEAGVHPPREL